MPAVAKLSVAEAASPGGYALALGIALAAVFVVAMPLLISRSVIVPASESTLYDVAKILFWIFALGVWFLPLRWSFLSLLLVMQVDVVAPEFVGASSVGWENAIRVLVLPALVLWRVLPAHSRKFVWTKSVQLWVVFVLYVALAGLWSPYKLATAKMVGYLLCYFVLFWAFYWGWQRNIIDAGLVSIALWGSLALGCFQSFVLGNPMDAWEQRFSSFCWPQAFGPWLASVLSVLLFHQGKIRFRWAAVVCCLTAMVMSGSRLAFVGSGFVFLAVWLQRMLKGKESLTLLSLVKSISGTGATLLVLCAVVLYSAPTNRLRELLLLGGHDYQSATDIGTVAARFMTYEAVLSELSSRNFARLLFGTGTSTGGEVVVNYNLVTTVGFLHSDYVDPNRSLNSDLFKTLYEWGGVGLLLGSLLIVRMVRSAWHLGIRQRSVPGFALLGVLPMILLGLGEDNILVGSASPIGVGMVLVVAWASTESAPIADSRPISARTRS